jgi:hypothetical protein
MTPRLILGSAVAIACFWSLAPTGMSAQRSSGSVVFRDVRVFDGKLMHERAMVVVVDGHIVSGEQHCDPR